MMAIDFGALTQAIQNALPASQVKPLGPASYSIDDFFSSINRNVQPTAYQPSTGGMTYEQLMQGVNEKAPMSIDDILSGIQSQFGNQSQYAATPYETGAQRFVSDVAPSAEYFVPAEFDAQKYKMDYESASDKAQRIYNETYADQIAQGKSEYEAQKKAAENAQFWGTAGGIAGSFLPIPGGTIIGSLIGSKLGNQLDSITKGAGDIVGGAVKGAGDIVSGGISVVEDIFDW